MGTFVQPEDATTSVWALPTLAWALPVVFFFREKEARRASPDDALEEDLDIRKQLDEPRLDDAHVGLPLRIFEFMLGF